jgi:uncharacterized protein (UPF0548 family)
VSGPSVPALAERRLTYSAAGATRPAESQWTEQPAGFRRYERTVSIGRGADLWSVASAAVLRWGVKTRSGFTVGPADVPVTPGADFWLLARFGPVAVREPVRVVAVVEESGRVGFAYGTLEGHPVAGEEAFVVHRATDGEVFLTLRSLTRAPQGRWRLAFPAALIAQRW